MKTLVPSLLVFATLALANTAPAGAARSATVEVDGGSVTLIVAEPSPGETLLRGALSIELKPGWKTYWRDPGSSGMPPQIDVSGSGNVTGATLQFPAPTRLEDKYSTFAGYNRTVLLPVRFDRAAAGQSVVRANVFLGICEHICVPVNATLEATVHEVAASSADSVLVERAFAALPQEARDGFRIVEARIDGDRLVVSAEVPAGGAWTIFIDGAGRWSFGIPEPASSDAAGRIDFTVAVMRAPKSATAPATLSATLSDGERSISQDITLRH